MQDVCSQESRRERSEIRSQSDEKADRSVQSWSAEKCRFQFDVVLPFVMTKRYRSRSPRREAQFERAMNHQRSRRDRKVRDPRHSVTGIRRVGTGVVVVVAKEVAADSMLPLLDPLPLAPAADDDGRRAAVGLAL